MRGYLAKVKINDNIFKLISCIGEIQIIYLLYFTLKAIEKAIKNTSPTTARTSMIFSDARES